MKEASRTATRLCLNSAGIDGDSGRKEHFAWCIRAPIPRRGLSFPRDKGGLPSPGLYRIRRRRRQKADFVRLKADDYSPGLFPLPTPVKGK